MNEYEIKLKPEEISVVGQALAGMPYGQVAALIAKIQTQVIEQEKDNELKAGEK